MMDALKSAEARRIDNLTCQKVKSYDLMEKAGQMMADIIFSSYKIKNVLIVLGSGGNAGDGLVVGRFLEEKGVGVSIYKISNIKNPDAQINLEKFKGNIVTTIDFKYDLIIDAILGNNQHDKLKDEYIDIINKINESNIKVVSLDMPTGIESDNGLSLGAFIKSDLTITVEYPKLGLFLNDGLDSYNKLKTIKLGMVSPSINSIYHINSKDDFKNILTKRNRNSNKGSYGRASIIAGSILYSGASMISNNALISFMMGVGYQHLYVPKSLFDVYILRNPEIIVSPLSEENGFIKYNEEELDKIIKSSDSIAIGMGMGVSLDLYKSICYILKHFKGNLIIDADAINTIAKYGVDCLKEKTCKTLLTPHPKEFERISGLSKEYILENQIKSSVDFARKYAVCLILKGASSIITSGMDTKINTFGNTALAKGGSGDALSGILCGLLAEFDMNTLNISLASYILGASAEMAIKYESERTLTISKITKYIPNVIMDLENNL